MKEPYYPLRKVSYGNVYFFIKTKTYNLNPFDTYAVKKAMTNILLEAKEVSPSYKLFMAAATKATGLSERTVARYLKG